MSSLTELSTAGLRDAGDAVETVIEFRDYLPADGMLLMLAGRWRDDIRELLGMPPLGPVKRGPKIKAIEGITDSDLDRLFEAALMLNGRFTGYMDDPELVRRLSDVLAQVGSARVARVIPEEAKAS